jgi:hypothetical protein
MCRAAARIWAEESGIGDEDMTINVVQPGIRISVAASN